MIEAGPQSSINMKKAIKLIAAIIAFVFMAQQISTGGSTLLPLRNWECAPKRAGLRPAATAAGCSPIADYPIRAASQSSPSSQGVYIFDAMPEGDTLGNLIFIPIMGGKRRCIPVRKVHAMLDTLESTVDSLANTDGFPEGLVLGLDVSQLATFCIKAIEGNPYNNTGNLIFREAVKSYVNANGMFKITMLGQFLNENSNGDELTKQQKQTAAVRALLLRNALERLAPGINEEMVLLKDCVYAAMLPDEEWDSLRTGLRRYAAHNKKGRCCYTELLSKGRRFIKRQIEEGNGRYLSMVALPDDLRLAIRKLAANSNGFQNIGKSALVNLIKYIKENPQETGEHKRLFEYTARSSESGIIYMGYLPEAEGRHYIDIFNLKPNTLYRIVPVFDKYASKWVIGLLELDEESCLPVSCIPQMCKIIDGKTRLGMSDWAPVQLAVDYIKARADNKELPLMPQYILVENTTTTGEICLGTFERAEKGTCIAELYCSKFKDKDAFRLKFDTEDPHYGLTVEVYDIDAKTGQDKDLSPLAYFYYDFKNLRFIPFSKATAEIPSTARRHTFDAIFGLEDTPAGIFVDKPEPFLVNCDTEGTLYLQDLKAVLKRAALLSTKRKFWLTLRCPRFHKGNDYLVNTYYNERYGWLFDVYDAKYPDVAVYSCRLVARPKPKYVIGPLINKRWLKAVKGRSALAKMYEYGYVDLADTVTKGYIIGFEHFIRGKEAFIDLLLGKDTELTSWEDQVATKDGYYYFNRNGKRIAGIKTNLPKGAYCSFDVIYSRKMQCRLLFCFNHDDKDSLEDANPTNVWRIDQKTGKLREVELDAIYQRSLLKEIAARHRPIEDLRSILLKSGLIRHNYRMPKRAQEAFSRIESQALRSEIKDFLLSVLPEARRVLEESNSLACGHEKRPSGYPDSKLFLVSVALQWQGIQDLAYQQDNQYAERAVGEISKFVNLLLEDIHCNRKFLQHAADYYFTDILAKGSLEEARRRLNLLAIALDNLVPRLLEKRAEAYLTAKKSYVERAIRSNGSPTERAILLHILSELLDGYIYALRYTDATVEESPNGNGKIHWFDEEGDADETVYVDQQVIAVDFRKQLAVFSFAQSA